MKKLYLLSFFTFSFTFSISCFGQFNTYHPFPDSNAAWRETEWWPCPYCTPSDEGFAEFDYFVHGDTIVTGKTYSKLNYSGGYEHDEFGDTVLECFNSLYCLLRNDTANRKVYASFSPHYGTDTLLYDFNLRVGDTLPSTYINGSNNFLVYAIDSILVGTTYRKQFIIAFDTLLRSNVFDSIIEGIGSKIGLMEYMMMPIGGGNNLDCFVDSTIEFPYNSGCNIFYTCPIDGITPISAPAPSISVYPNPSSGVFTASIRNEEVGITNVQVYNVLGEKVYSNSYKPSANSYKPFTIDLSSNPNGIYLYRITDASGKLIGTGKLIINK